MLMSMAIVGALAVPALGGDPRPPCSRGACPDDVPALCQPAEAKPNWPRFHLFDNVTLTKDGLAVEGLNDINAIFQYRGLYHVMNQAGGGDCRLQPHHRRRRSCGTAQLAARTLTAHAPPSDAPRTSLI